MLDCTVNAHCPTDRETVTALRLIARALEQECAYAEDGRFWFPLSDTWALAVSAEAGGRFRLSACYGQTEVCTLWALAHDRRRLADMAQGLRAEVHALRA